MDLKAFRRDISKALAGLESAHASGYVYITSVDNREKNIAAGTVTEVTLQHAATRLCERTHQVSTPEEIEGYHERGREIKAQIVADGKRHLDRELRISVNK
jgi:hypothetical protein